MSALKLQWRALVPVAALAFVLWWCWPGSPPPGTANDGPQTMEDVISVVQEAGLHYRGDAPGDVISRRLIVSQKPLTWEEANNLSLGARPKSTSSWDGAVAVYPLSKIGAGCELSWGRGEVWGEMYLFGDPALIERLTGQPAQHPR